MAESPPDDAGPLALVAAALSVYRDRPPDEALESVVQGQPHDVSSSLWHEVREALQE